MVISMIMINRNKGEKKFEQNVCLPSGSNPRPSTYKAGVLTTIRLFFISLAERSSAEDRYTTAMDT